VRGADAQRAGERTVALTRAQVHAHLPALLRLDAETPGEPWRAEHWLADAPWKWRLSRLVLDGARPVGFLVASRKPDALHVHRIAVDASMRRRGIAETLIRALAERALRERVEALSLKVQETNEPALALYARLGFRAVHSADRTLQLRARAADVAAHAPSSLTPPG
jgi:ribosomal-protein-alanine N-acetyltransferase